MVRSIHPKSGYFLFKNRNDTGQGVSRYTDGDKWPGISVEKSKQVRRGGGDAPTDASLERIGAGQAASRHIDEHT